VQRRSHLGAIAAEAGEIDSARVVGERRSTDRVGSGDHSPEDLSVPGQNVDVQPIRLGEVVRSNLWIIVLTALVGLGLGIGASTQLEPQSTATAKILLTPLEGNPFYPSSRGEQLVNLETEAQALRSTQVAELAKAAIPSDTTPAELLGRVDVSVPVNTQILEVSYTAGQNDAAKAGAQAFADKYLEYRQTNATTLIDEQVANLDQQIETVSSQLTEQSNSLSTLPENSPQATLIREQLGTLSSQLATLNATRTDLTTRSTDPGQLVTPAEVSTSGPITPQILLPVLGLLLGIAGGVVIGLIRTRSDDRLRDPGDVLDLGLTVIGTIGWTDSSATSKGAATTNADAEQDDEFRKLRVAVLAMEKRRPFTLLVAGASAGSPGPVSVVDLAASLARSGLDTVVVDATSNGAGPARVLDPGNETGLAEVLLGDAVLTEALSPVAPLLWVLPPGQGIDTVADLFVGGEMSRLLSAAKDHCDVVVVAADSLQQGVAQSLADMAEAVIIETDQDVTTRSELERTARAMELLRCSFLGAVFIGRDVAKRPQQFRPHLALNQRQLPAGPFAALGPTGDTAPPPEGATTPDGVSDGATAIDPEPAADPAVDTDPTVDTAEVQPEPPQPRAAKPASPSTGPVNGSSRSRSRSNSPRRLDEPAPDSQ